MNNELALIGQHYVVSWFAVFTAAGCLAGTILACIIRALQKRAVSDVLIAVTFAVPLGLMLGRVYYCLFAASDYPSVWQMLWLPNGGYGLLGGILGVFLAAALAFALFRMEGFGELLDCLALGGLAAIITGRFASGFSGSELGYEVPFRLFTVYNEEKKLRVLAVYELDGLVDAVILVVCVCYWMVVRRKNQNARTGGLTALLMLGLHGANQVVMESMRSDALKLGANDFIKSSQILGVCCCVAALVTCMVRVIRAKGFHRNDLFYVLASVCCIALGVLAEWRVGKGDYVIRHVLMLAVMFALGAITVRYGVAAGLAASSVPRADEAPVADEALTEDDDYPVAEQAVPDDRRRSYWIVRDTRQEYDE